MAGFVSSRVRTQPSNGASCLCLLGYSDMAARARALRKACQGYKRKFNMEMKKTMVQEILFLVRQFPSGKGNMVIRFLIWLIWCVKSKDGGI